MYLIYEVRKYMNKRKKYFDEVEKSKEFGKDIFLSKPQHHYCLTQGRHSGNFYLKIGAAGFFLGHIVHSGLLLSYQIVFLTSDREIFDNCANVTSLILDILNPLYSFFLLYFLFKYSNVLVKNYKKEKRN